MTAIGLHQLAVAGGRNLYILNLTELGVDLIF